MATSGSVKAQFGSVSGLGPTPWDTMLRSHRKAGTAPFGEAGRGQHTGHFFDNHLAGLLLGLGAGAWNEAGDAAKLIGAMRYAGTNPSSAETPAQHGETLLDAVARAIRTAALHIERDNPAVEPLVPFSITISLSAVRSGRIAWRHGGLAWVDSYLPDAGYQPNGAVSRHTTMSDDLIFAAGALLLDTWERCGRDASAAPPSGGGDASAEPENTNGATLPGAAPRGVRSHNQASGAVRRPESKVSRASGQSYFYGCGFGPVSQPLGVTAHDQRRRCAARE